MDIWENFKSVAAFIVILQVLGSMFMAFVVYRAPPASEFYGDQWEGDR